MNKSNIYWYIGIILFFIVLFRKPIKTGYDMAKEKLTRGYRNRNPGNIVLTPGQMWKGEIKGTDTRFKTFQSMEYGYRAIFVTLSSYLTKGFNTIEKIINRYAPPHENATTSYSKTVANRSGIPETKVLTFNNPDELIKIVEAISFVENGITPDITQVKTGYQLFKGV